MTLDPTLVYAVVAIILADKVFAWVLIIALLRGQRAQTFPVPPVVVPPTTEPVQPPVVVQPPAVQPPIQPPLVPPAPVPTPIPVPTPTPTPVPIPTPAPVPTPAAGLPRFTGITTTSFAGVSDSDFSKRSAYTGKVIDSSKPGAALPYHFPGTPPVIRVFFRGKTVDCPIVDVGPWNTHDTYWDHGARPQAESGTDTTGRHTNRAGLDLTPGAWAALGKTGNLDAITDITSWDFVSVLDKGNVAPGVPVPPVGPAQPSVTGGTVLQHNTWPAQSEAESFFGSPGSNLVSVQCPWQLIVEGTKSTHNTITIHQKCAASLTRVLNYIWEQCGKSQAQIDAFGYNIFDGSFNERPIGSTHTLSQHSWAAAIDWNAAANPQHATASQTKFKEDSLIVTAFKAEGWTWGGDWSPKYRDAMHVQALKA